MMRIAFLFFFLFVILFSRAQQFPSLKAVSLAGKEITVPENNGKYTVVAIAFSRNAEEDLRRWLNPLYETFVHTEKNAGGLSPAEVNDVNFYFIPLISGLKKLADDFKNKTDKEFWPYILDTEKTDIKALEKALQVKDDNAPWFFVLDKSGKVIEKQYGTFQPAKLDKLEDAADPD